MFIRKSTHDAIVAAKDAEIARFRKAASSNFSEVRQAWSQIDRLKDELIVARARLAVFTAPRARNAKGHFLPLDATVKGAR